MDTIPKTLTPFLDEQGRLTAWPARKRRAVQLAALRHIAQAIDPAREYDEKGINQLIAERHTFEDNALLRREMVESGLLNRTRDCRKYWRPTE